jgi:hypothetical protein
MLRNTVYRKFKCNPKIQFIDTLEEVYTDPDTGKLVFRSYLISCISGLVIAHASSYRNGVYFKMFEIAQRKACD